MKHGSILSCGVKALFRYHLLLLAAALLSIGPRAGAQFLSITVSNTPSPVVVNSDVTYTINVTNLSTSGLQIQVTNTFSGAVQLLGASNFTFGTSTITTNANGYSFLFSLGTFGSGFPTAQLTVQAAPTQAGAFTNFLSVYAFGLTNFTASIVITATNAVAAQADLAVAIGGPSQFVITNDWMTYCVMATNLGPDSATNVVLTNTLPPGVAVESASQGYSLSGSNLILNIGTLTNGGFDNVQFTVQPTNAGVQTFSASIGAPNNVDPNPTNNYASTNITVLAYLGVLSAVTNSPQTLDLQNGLLEQSILLSSGTNNVPAGRLVVTGLTNRLYNAVGTNSGNPFVYYSAPLAPGQSQSLLLQFAQRTSFTLTNGQLQAFGVPMPNWTPPVESGTSTNFNPSRILLLTNGNALIEWPAITNRNYTVVYADNLLFSNAMIAPPTILAPANRVQWIDYGPPTTVSAVTNSSARFYRIILNP